MLRQPLNPESQAETLNRDINPITLNPNQRELQAEKHVLELKVLLGFLRSPSSFLIARDSETAKGLEG